MALDRPLPWRTRGRGGRCSRRLHDFLFRHVNGGIWKTTDAGTVWTPIFDGQPVGSIGALAVAPSDPSTIYAGTGESDIRSRSPPAMAYTNPPMAAAHGNISDSKTHAKSAESSSIRRIPMSSTSARWDTLTLPMSNAVSTNQPMAECIGPKFSTRVPKSASPTWPSAPEIRTFYLLEPGTRGVRHGVPMLPSTVQAAGCSAQRMPARHGLAHLTAAACQKEIGDE